jgi:peptide/nickel transport system permease protein
MIPTLFIVSIIIFFMIRLVPGTIVDAMVAQMAEVGAAGGGGRLIDKASIEHALGLDVPVLTQYGRWIGVVPQAIAVPGFWLATMVIVFPSIWWGYMPPIMLIRLTEDPIGNLQMFIVPAIILGMVISGDTMRMTRTMMLEVLRQDYIRTAWAKGLRERVVVIRHALKNALIPVITLIGYDMPIMIGGAVIIEQIFCLPGMGRLMLQSMAMRDYTMVSGMMLILGFGMVFINLMVDLTYGFLDPRVHYK